eukprot:CAMPEP_0118864030 /NCGR_PEP_ID=MMETSP1163-20130328/8710_1 /TAXON_ID=124430 /ORGANISM="Phaeomonas parva, Strain CCMP2877" /LENGTH=1054 /DNA_ID=CAMNT_0006798099 /DNA_START=229 /DNA_END=3393 /DNA_ORIENTATION=-
MEIARRPHRPSRQESGPLSTGAAKGAHASAGGGVRLSISTIAFMLAIVLVIGFVAGFQLHGSAMDPRLEKSNLETMHFVRKSRGLDGMAGDGNAGRDLMSFERPNADAGSRGATSGASLPASAGSLPASAAAAKTQHSGASRQGAMGATKVAGEQSAAQPPQGAAATTVTASTSAAGGAAMGAAKNLPPARPQEAASSSSTDGSALPPPKASAALPPAAAVAAPPQAPAPANIPQALAAVIPQATTVPATEPAKPLTKAPDTAATPTVPVPAPPPAVEAPVSIPSFFHAGKGDLISTGVPVDAARLTASAWIFPNAEVDGSGVGVPQTMRTVLTNRRSGCGTDALRHGFSLFVNNWETADGCLVLEWADSRLGCQKLSTAPGMIPSGKWTHVAAVFDDGLVSLYVNKRKIGQVTASLRDKLSHAPFYVGRFPMDESGNQYVFEGGIGRVAVFGGAASPGSIEDLYAATAQGELGNLRVTDARGQPLDSLLLLPLHDAPTPQLRASNPDVPIPLKELQKVQVHPKIVSGKAIAAPAPSQGTVRTAPAPAPGAGSSSSSGSGASSGKGFAAVDLASLNYGFDVTRTLPAAEKDKAARLAAQRAEKVKEAMQHAWKGYKSNAWGYDELLPVSGRKQNNWGGMGVTLVDSLDTLWLMDMKDEFYEARDWVKNSLSFDRAGTVSVFETTIRELGGLLSAYDLSGDAVFLDKARVLGDRLLKAFDTPSGIPAGRISLNAGPTSANLRGSSRSVLAEIGTLQVEFRYLSHATGNSRYAEKANKVFEALEGKDRNGLYGIYVDTRSASVSGDVTFGALGDSFYEYMLKVWLQGGKQETMYRRMYDAAVDGIIKSGIWTKTPQSGYSVLGDLKPGGRNVVKKKMDHLACFMAGVLALGAYTNEGGMASGRNQRDLRMGQALAHSCYQMYATSPTGLSPEFVTFDRGDFTAGNPPHYILRPEVSESLFVLHQITSDPIYQEWGWKIFEAIDRNCRTRYAFGAYGDVRREGRNPDDSMESFFLGETLKYLYLLQAPGRKVDLTQSVFNTEAHPLSNFKPSWRIAT